MAERADPQRVVGDVIEGVVSGHGRDAAEVDLRHGRRHQHGQRVVVAGVAVEQDADR